MSTIEDFEGPITELEAQIERVERLTREQGIDRSAEIDALKAEVRRLLTEIYARPTGWDEVRIARSQKRPFSLDFIRLIFDDFTELHGDRLAGDDGAVVAGTARLGEQWVTVVGHQKGRDAQERHRRNFGYARPEGYRKALRVMRLAEKFRRPVVCLVDTPGADCSVGSEERGISEAIARNIHEMFLLRVPILVAVTGEGGSGGALGIGVGDRILMLEHAVYSVIAPEGCAAILWKDPKRGADAAEALRLTARHAREFGVVDEVVPEPLGSASRDFDTVSRALKEALVRHLGELQALDEQALLEVRYARFRTLARFVDRCRESAGQPAVSHPAA
jgi:acetyl-CoA carboxylase carboxyl transferase subunit alpha